MSTAAQVELLLAGARREERTARAALVIAERSMHVAAVEIADAEADHHRLGQIVDQYRALRTSYRLAQRRWRTAKEALVTALNRRAA